MNGVRTTVVSPSMSKSNLHPSDSSKTEQKWYVNKVYWYFPILPAGFGKLAIYLWFINKWGVYWIPCIWLQVYRLFSEGTAFLCETIVSISVLCQYFVIRRIHRPYLRPRPPRRSLWDASCRGRRVSLWWDAACRWCPGWGAPAPPAGRKTRPAWRTARNSPCYLCRTKRRRIRGQWTIVHSIMGHFRMFVWVYEPKTEFVFISAHPNRL